MFIGIVSDAPNQGRDYAARHFTAAAMLPAARTIEMLTGYRGFGRLRVVTDWVRRFILLRRILKLRNESLRLMIRMPDSVTVVL